MFFKRKNGKRTTQPWYASGSCMDPTGKETLFLNLNIIK